MVNHSRMFTRPAPVHVSGGYDEVRRIGGATTFLLNGVLHREDGPAVVHRDGRVEWFLHGEKSEPHT